MNSIYIKRQLVLKDFGIPMTEDVQRYYKLFNNIYSSDTTMEYKPNLNRTGIFNKRTYISVYDHDTKIMWIDNYHVVYNFTDLFDVTEEDVCDILSPFLEHRFKKDIKSILPLHLNIN